ncbi:AAA-ATPase At3g50940-like [Curcuma longa]|uniref:AAA-ATPase At3g50940-like n=1 Tax=Curcuma longa TaxID=136217 RepID=UPI003D9DC5C3
MAWDWSSIGSVFATLLFLRTAYRDFLPPEFHRFISFLLRDLMARFNNDANIIIEEYDDITCSTNELYGAAQTYLGARCLDDAAVVKLTKIRDSPLPAASLPGYHTTYDSFQGIPLQWKSVVVAQADGSNPSGRSSRPAEHHSLKLTFHQRHRHAVRSLYIPHVLEEAKRIAIASRQRRLFTNRADSIYGDDRRNLWSPAPFSHSSTFDTLAIDPALRDDIRGDLLRFVDRRDYYARVGRPWKRGYLLHGPPGTGKTSLIAAIANMLEFDVYDLELTAVHSNTALRRLLASTTPKSVVVIEDADCSLDLSDRKKKKKQDEKHAKAGEEEPTPTSNRSRFSTVSLSGVLNFVDGLWSSSVGERLMILTTNHPERLDPAMLRPGRMDRKIHLSYCRPAAFRVLARNYLEVGEEHPRMAEAEALLREVEMTPADVAEVFMRCDAEGEGADAAMDEVVMEMRRRKREAAAASAAEIHGECQGN